MKEHDVLTPLPVKRVAIKGRGYDAAEFVALELKVCFPTVGPEAMQQQGGGSHLPASQGHSSGDIH